MLHDMNGYPEHKRGLKNNITQIVIDGCDVSGKETTSKQLVEMLEGIYGAGTIYRKSLPDYVSASGKEIRNRLLGNTPSKFRDLSLAQLFELNRKMAYMDIEERYNTVAGDVKVIIWDRHAISNYLLGTADVEVVKNEMERLEERFGKVHAYFLFAEYDKHDVEIHERLINQKKDKDQNETMEKQAEVSERCLRAHMDLTIEVVAVPISMVIEDNEVALDKMVKIICEKIEEVELCSDLMKI